MPLKYSPLLLVLLVCRPCSADEIPFAWLDTLHDNVSGSLHTSSEWIDSFFSEGDNQDKSRVTARIRLGWEPKESDLDDYLSRVKLKVRLPKLEKKVDLIFSDYNEISQEGIADEVIRERRTEQDNDFNVALRWTHKSDKLRYFSTRIGLASHPDIYGRAMYRRIYPTSDHSNIVLQPSLYYYIDQGVGARFSANYEYSYTNKSMFEQNNSWRYLEEKDQGAVKWNHSLLHYYQFDQDSALISGIFANGITEDSYRVKNRGIFGRYRFRSLRSWLFFEIEPFVHFPQDRNYDRTFGIALRVEGNFKR